jgi:oligopeptidase B
MTEPTSPGTQPPQPPTARRDESRVVYAGKVVSTEDSDNTLPRQSESSTEALLDPPMAIPDPYGWLRDDERKTGDSEVYQHLLAEKEYTTQITAHLEPLRKTLYEELKSSIQETDYTVPRPRASPDSTTTYFYYSRTFEGQSYTVHCRAPVSNSEPLFPVVSWDGQASTHILPNEEVLLNVNELATGKPYCGVGSVKPSPSQEYLAYTADFSGDETCLLYVTHLKNSIDSHAIVDHDPKLEVADTLVWGSDDTTLFYLTLDETKRPYRVYRRKLQVIPSTDDQPRENDELLFEEKDEMFFVGISKSLDGRYLFVHTSSVETSEVHYLDLKHPALSAEPCVKSMLECVAPRRHKVLYEVQHRLGYWWISSNTGNLPNMALFAAPATSNSAESWQLILNPEGTGALFDGSYAQSLDSVTCFSRHVAVEGRKAGLPRVWILSVSDSEPPLVQSCHMLSFPEEACSVALGTHFEYDTDHLVVGYDSMVTPPQSLAIRMDDVNNRILLKEKVVPNYNKEEFASERSFVLSRDGTTQIPVSFLFRKDVMAHHLQSKSPVYLHLYGYGSYGICMEADFCANRLPLINRGVVYVIAHVRGTSCWNHEREY